jgi:hypothetical protein
MYDVGLCHTCQAERSNIDRWKLAELQTELLPRNDTRR